MSEQDETNVDTGRVGFRDIYRAVGESETRLTLLITNALGPFRASLDDHERRLRSIEQDGSREAKEAAAVAARALVKAEAVETAADLVKGRQDGVAAALSFGQKAFLFLVGVFTLINLLVGLHDKVTP